MNRPWEFDVDSMKVRRESLLSNAIKGSKGLHGQSDLLERTEVLIELGAAEEALQLLEANRSSFTEAAVPKAQQSEFSWLTFRAHWENNDWRSADRYLSKITKSEAVTSSDHLTRMQIWKQWGDLYDSLDFETVQAAMDQIAADQRGFVSSALLLAEHSYLSSYIQFRHIGNCSAALKAADLAASLFGYIDDRPQLAKCLALQTVIRKSTGCLSSALASADAALSTSLEAANPYLIAVSLTQYLVCLYRSGRIEDAIGASENLLSLGQAFSYPKWEFHSHLALSRVRLLSGDLSSAAEDLRRAEKCASASNLAQVTEILLEYKAQLRLLEGDARAALALLEEAESNLQAGRTTSYELAELNLRKAEAYLQGGQYHDAIQECETALRRLEEVGQGLERGHILRVLALAKHSLGRPTEAAEIFDRAERELRQVGDIFELGKLLVDKAELSEGDAEARVADAAEAVNLLQRVGVESELQRARDVLSLTQTVLRRQHSIRIHHEEHADDRIIAESEAMKVLLADARVCGQAEAPALITGETGVGKEILARCIHDNSRRAKKAFVAVNCAAVPDTLFEREFFGHTKGSFTGADRDREGLLEAAHGGTLFLDEIGELAPPMQSKLLRVLQEGTYRRVGEIREREVDLRIVSATNQCLADQVKRKAFREDLFYRLAWFEFDVPPLRERQEDLTALAKLFLVRESRRAEMTYWIDKFAWACLRRYPWPGNIRELESAIGAGCARAGADGCVQVEHLPPRVAKEKPLRQQPQSDLNLAVALEKKERELILEALRRTGHQRTAAARLLGIGRNTLYDKMKRLVVDPEAARRSGTGG